MKTTIKSTALFNLEQYVSIMEGDVRKENKVKTLAYQIPYGMAKGLAHKAKTSPQVLGTFFKIVPNIKQA